MQLAAPVPERVFVTEPATQTTHAAVGAELNRPAAHAVHAVAPVATSMFVTDPGAHGTHELRLLVGEYCPAAHWAHGAVDAALDWPAGHAVHAVAPVVLSAFVTEPAAHGTQAPKPLDAAYWPGTHWAHATVATALDWPAGHAVHAVAPVLLSAFVIEPAVHTIHALWLVVGLYCPAAHATQALV
jgi:hypothetical protein